MSVSRSRCHAIDRNSQGALDGQRFDQRHHRTLGRRVVGVLSLALPAAVLPHQHDAPARAMAGAARAEDRVGFAAMVRRHRRALCPERHFFHRPDAGVAYKQSSRQTPLSSANNRSTTPGPPDPAEAKARRRPHLGHPARLGQTAFADADVGSGGQENRRRPPDTAGAAVMSTRVLRSESWVGVVRKGVFGHEDIVTCCSHAPSPLPSLLPLLSPLSALPFPAPSHDELHDQMLPPGGFPEYDWSRRPRPRTPRARCPQRTATLRKPITPPPFPAAAAAASRWGSARCCCTGPGIPLPTDCRCRAKTSSKPRSFPVA